MLKDKIQKKTSGLYSKKTLFTEPEQEGLRAFRAEELITAAVTIDGIEYDADEKSIDRMDRVISVANAQYAETLASGVTPQQAYSIIFSTQIPWKTKDNSFVTIDIATLVRIQTVALNNIETVWVKYG